jgi:ribosomal protein S18 acetylase RimI-like enzyme
MLLTLVTMFCLLPVHDAFAPSFGLGGIFFQPKGLITKSVKGEMRKLQDASSFFVDAFWVGKVGGGASKLSERQKGSLSATQFMEFRERYSQFNRGKSELVICELPDGEVVGCAGIELSPIPDGDLKAPSKLRAPLMSNLAVSRNYRRKGIGVLLVKEAERIARYEWGSNDCYLYVERRNTAAVKLYQKLGYRMIWIDRGATTLLLTESGRLESAPTEIVCMKKRLNLGAFSRLWPF